MAGASRHDVWNAGDSYDAYMGRWSRKLAEPFLNWLDPAERLDWVEVGCGTGALSAAIVERCDPSSLVGVDPSEGFIARARQSVPDPRATFKIGDAQALPVEDGSCDIAASALVLNFVPDQIQALREMMRVARSGAGVAFCVWDYPGGGMEFMRAFWAAAAALDSAAADLAENKRFQWCTQDGLRSLALTAGLAAVEVVPIKVPTVFKDFADYWEPFLLGVGPAPAYCMSLAEDRREQLRGRLKQTLPRGEDGSIPLKARAWAVKAVVNAGK